jgi:hypothetical protein
LKIEFVLPPGISGSTGSMGIPGMSIVEYRIYRRREKIKKIINNYG